MKRFFRHLFLGYKSYGSAIQMVIDHRLYIYFLIPCILMIGIHYLGVWVVNQQQSPAIDTVRTMNDMVWYAISQHSLDIVGTIVSKSSKYLVVILLSPLFAFVSERIEEILTANRYPFNFKQTVKDVKRGVRIALRNVMWEYFFLIVVIGLTSFLDGGIKTALFFSLPLLIGFYYYGFSFLDYINERRRLNIEQSIYFIRKHRGVAMAIGSIYSLLFLLPIDFREMMDFKDFDNYPWQTIIDFVINFIFWILISAAPVLAIIAATIAMHETVDLSNNEYAIKSTDENNDPENGAVFEDKL